MLTCCLATIKEFIMKTSIIIFSLLALSSCIKHNDDQCNLPENRYEFVLQYTLSPAQEYYHIGDTITISSIVKNPVYERNTNSNYILNNFKFYMKNSIWFMDTINNYKNYHFFKLIIDTSYYYNIFEFSNGTSHLQFQYNYSSNNYSITYKLIPQKKGHFLSTFWSDINYVDGDQYFAGKCQKVDDHAVCYLNNRLDNNIDLIDEAKNQNYKYYKLNKEQNYLDAGGFCFKVID
jgi:hypothetical protein